MRLLPAILGLLAFVALVLPLFNLTWAYVRQAGGGPGGYYAEHAVDTWQDHMSAGFAGYSGGQSKGWFEGDHGNGSGAAVAQLRIAAPLLVAAVVLALLGGVVGLVVPSRAGSIVLLAAFACALAATLLYSIAAQDLLDGQQKWGAGIWWAGAGCVLALAAAVAGLAQGGRAARAS